MSRSFLKCFESMLHVVLAVAYGRLAFTNPSEVQVFLTQVFIFKLNLLLRSLNLNGPFRAFSLLVLYELVYADEDVFRTVLAGVNSLASPILAPSDVEQELPSVELLVITVEWTQKCDSRLFCHL